ncbi:MAG: copper homeostasis protein CutC [Planctomycetes bacterium]|nr:copper homeostasis protein CutC [Planctomycetota bacterium]
MHASANARVVVEVAVDSLAGARAAATAGADRLELCASLGEGGVTPSRGLLDAVRAAVRVPVFAMIRPRRGDFLYSADEFAVMLRDVRHARDGGADGIVSGVLRADGQIDEERMRELIAAAAPLPFTCHRAFDLCADPDRALDALRRLGAARVLTSGQAASASAGAVAIARHVANAGTGLVVMAGSGVRPDNVRALVAATGVREVHLSAAIDLPSAMTFRRDGVPMGPRPPADEYGHRATDGHVVAALVRALIPPPRNG